MRQLVLIIALSTSIMGGAQVKNRFLQIIPVTEALYTLGNLPVECETSGLSELDTLRVIQIIYNNYPNVKGKDTGLVNPINRMVLGNLLRDGVGLSKKEIKIANCSEDRPSTITTTYSVFCHTQRYLNLCLFQDMEPYGLGNGFGHYVFPICYDLVKRQSVMLNDLLEPEAFDKMVTRVSEQVVKNYPGMFLGDTKAQELINAREHVLSNLLYVFDNKALYFFVSLNFGGKVAYDRFSFSYESEKGLFRREFLIQWQKK